MLNYIEERRHDFQAQCRNIIKKSSTPLTIEEIINIAIRSAAPRYYVSHRMAMRVIRRMRHGGFNVLNLQRRRQWEEIERKVASWEKRGYSTSQAVSMVLAGAVASSYFISARTAHRILQQNSTL